MPPPVVQRISKDTAKRAWNLASGETRSFHNQYDRESYDFEDFAAGQRGMALGYLAYRKWIVFAGTDVGVQIIGMNRHGANRHGAARQDRFRKLVTHTFECLVRHSSKKSHIPNDVQRVALARDMNPDSFVLYAGFVHGLMSQEYRDIVQEAVTAEWEDDETARRKAPPAEPAPVAACLEKEPWWFTPPESPAPPPAPAKRPVSNVCEMDESSEDDESKRPRVGNAPPKIASGEAAAARAAAAAAAAAAPPPAEKKRDERRRFPMSIPKVRVCSVPGPTAAQLEARERALWPEYPPPYAADHEVLCSSGNWRQMQAPTGEGAVFASHLGVYFYNVRTQEQFWNLPQVYQDEDMEQLYQDEDPQPVPNAPFARGERAIVVASGKCGTVRFVGELPPFAGDWVGLEMDEPCGNCDGGSFSGVYYFWCMKDHGIYIRPNRLALAATVCDEGVAAVNRAAAKVAELDARVRAELAAEKEAENAAGPSADLAPMTDDDEPTPTGGPPAESAPAPTPAPTPTPVPTPVPTPKITRSWQVPRASRSLVALQEKMNASPTTLNVLNYLFVKAKLLAGASKLEYDSMGRAVLESTSSQWYICVKSRGRRPEDAADKLRKSATKWDAYVVACGRAAQRLREWQPKSYCNGSLRSEVQIKRFFESNPDFNEHLSIPA